MPLTYLNAPLKEQLMLLSAKIDPSRNTAEQISVYLEELIDLTTQAYEKKDFNFLGACADVTRKLSAACFGYLHERDDLAERFMEHYKLDPHVFTEFFIGKYLEIPHEIGDSIFTQMVQNVIKHQSFFDVDRPRLAGQMLESVLAEARISEPAIALFKTIVLTNTGNLSGAGQGIHALAEAREDQPEEVDFLDVFFRMANNQGLDLGLITAPVDKIRAKLHKNTEVNDAVLAWARDHQEVIADSIKAGPVTEWINDSIVTAAKDMNLPVIVGALAIRSCDFTFSVMSDLYVNQGVLSDEKHMCSIRSYPSHEADIVAFSLVHEDVLENIEFHHDMVELIESSLEMVGDTPFNLLSIHTVVGKLVHLMNPRSDVTNMLKSRLSPHLQRHRRFNGMRLDNEMGL
jgi:hypothetical protein